MASGTGRHEKAHAINKPITRCRDAWFLPASERGCIRLLPALTQAGSGVPQPLISSIGLAIFDEAGTTILLAQFYCQEGGAENNGGGPSSMSDYVKSRPAKAGEKLRTQHFHPGRVGFASPEDASTAVCVLSGTELAFATAIRCSAHGLFGWKMIVLNQKTATFRQINKDNPRTHGDALEFPDGRMVLLTHLLEGQEATVLQFPAQPVTVVEIKAQKRIRNVR